MTAIEGVEVGHYTDLRGGTGCTVVLAPAGGCCASAYSLGAAPGSREVTLLAPDKTMARIDAVVISGGSAYGLATADGVMRWLEEQGRGFDTGFARVPIVPAAVLFDLDVGSATTRPGAAAGYAAAAAASSAAVQQGRVGAGTGATVGKLRGPSLAQPSGLGSHLEWVEGARVGAVAVSNAVGNLVDPDTGALLAGVPGTLGMEAAEGFSGMPGANTTLVVVATDAQLNKAEAQALAQSAHVGIARVTRPSHTPFDGDMTFVLSTGTVRSASLPALSVGVQEVVARALVNGWRAVTGSTSGTELT